MPPSQLRLGNLLNQYPKLIAIIKFMKSSCELSYLVVCILITQPNIILYDLVLIPDYL